MNDSPDNLIKSEIKVRNVTYYLTTEDDLHNVKSNSLLGNIFSVLTSLTISGIISVALAKVTGIKLVQQVTDVLNILLYVFMFATIIFISFCVYFYYQSFIIIKKIKGSGVIKSFVNTEQNKAIEFKEESKLEIIKAEYWTLNSRFDVTEELRAMVVNNRLETIASNNIKGDPDKGTRKQLTIEYKFNAILVRKEFLERDKVILP